MRYLYLRGLQKSIVFLQDVLFAFLIFRNARRYGLNATLDVLRGIR